MYEIQQQQQQNLRKTKRNIEMTFERMDEKRLCYNLADRWNRRIN